MTTRTHRTEYVMQATILLLGAASYYKYGNNQYLSQEEISVLNKNMFLYNFFLKHNMVG